MLCNFIKYLLKHTPHLHMFEGTESKKNLQIIVIMAVTDIQSLSMSNDIKI